MKRFEGKVALVMAAAEDVVEQTLRTCRVALAKKLYADKSKEREVEDTWNSIG